MTPDSILKSATEEEPGLVVFENLYDFKKVLVEIYEIPEWAGQAWVDATLKIVIGKTPWRIFVGYLKGGYNYAVLFSTEMGAPVYERIGFHMTDVPINRYVWRNQ
jgi:hypothetical protein